MRSPGWEALAWTGWKAVWTLSPLTPHPEPDTENSSLGSWSSSHLGSQGVHIRALGRSDPPSEFQLPPLRKGDHQNACLPRQLGRFLEVVEAGKMPSPGQLWSVCSRRPWLISATCLSLSQTTAILASDALAASALQP